jgi:hypothetical protein
MSIATTFIPASKELHVMQQQQQLQQTTHPRFMSPNSSLSRDAIERQH